MRWFLVRYKLSKYNKTQEIQTFEKKDDALEKVIYIMQDSDKVLISVTLLGFKEFEDNALPESKALEIEILNGRFQLVEIQTKK